ncbi:hypothetical protein V8E53_000416 [Lactarius tabidus]
MTRSSKTVKPKHRTNRHLDRVEREPDKLNNSVLLPPPQTSSCVEPRIRANRQAAQPRVHTDTRRHHRSPARLTRRPQTPYDATAARGMHSGGGAGGFVWLVTDALGRHAVATHGAGTLLVAERRKSFVLNCAELGGIYEPAMPVPLNQLPPSSSSSDRGPAQVRAPSTSAHASAPRPADV